MKDSKKLLGLCVLLAFLSMPLAVLVSPMLSEQDFSAYGAEFIGQESAQVGELCRFLAEGEIVRWECLPPTTDSESYGANNENFVISFRTPGTFTVIAAIYENGDLTIQTQPVTVEGVVPVNPDKPTETTQLDTVLVGKVEGWVRKYKVKKKTCTSLANNFNRVASMISDGTLLTASEIISKTAELNTGLNLNENLMAELQAYLTSQSDLGNLRSPEQHLVAWLSIAKGLTNAAN